MPTAEDYRAGIAELDRRVDDLVAVARACDRYRDDFGYIGGAAPLVRAGIIAGAANASSAGMHCDGLRLELTRRAILCEIFTDQWKTYQAQFDAWLPRSIRYWNTPDEERQNLIQPYQPQPPTPPFVGAEPSR